jgi:hypothetical protein
MSGFVYKVLVGGEVLIKKEIPGPDTVDEFLYEVNALNALGFSKHVIRFYGLVVDDEEEYVKGLLISYAEKGALIDIIYDHRQDAAKAGCQDTTIPWPTRIRWARQVVEGLADIHESGFVQGDFTLSNIVIDHRGDAKIIDINRRGCPVGWEPPEATPLIKSSMRISMYIGVKSDLFQLGMVLWALATGDDEPETHERPLVLNPDDSNIPDWYRQMVGICLNENPRMRMQASSLLSLFPPNADVEQNYLDPYGLYTRNGAPSIRTVSPSGRWPYGGLPGAYDSGFGGYEPPLSDPWRGRSPPRSFVGGVGAWDAQRSFNGGSWSRSDNMASYSDVGVEEAAINSQSATPTTKRESALPVEKKPVTDSEQGQDARIGDTKTLDAVRQAGVEVVSFQVRGIETPSMAGKGNAGVSEVKADEDTGKSLVPGNTEPDVQIDSKIGIKGLKSETDTSGTAAQDAKPTASVEPPEIVETIGPSDVKTAAPAAPSEDERGDARQERLVPAATTALDPLAGVGAAYDAEPADLANMGSLEEELQLIGTTIPERSAEAGAVAADSDT